MRFVAHRALTRYFIPMTTISLPPDLEAWAEAEVAAGRAPSVEVFVTETLRGTLTARQEFATMIAEAIAEGDRDGWIDGDAMLREMDEMLADLEAEAGAETKRGVPAKG